MHIVHSESTYFIFCLNKYSQLVEISCYVILNRIYVRRKDENGLVPHERRIDVGWIAQAEK